MSYAAGRRGSSKAAVGPKPRRERSRASSVDSSESVGAGGGGSEVSDVVSDSSRVLLQPKRGPTLARGRSAGSGMMGVSDVSEWLGPGTPGAGVGRDLGGVPTPGRRRSGSGAVDRSGVGGASRGFEESPRDADAVERGYGERSKSTGVLGVSGGGDGVSNPGDAHGPRGHRKDRSQSAGSSAGSSVFLRGVSAREVVGGWRWMQAPRPENDEATSSVTTLSVDDLVL